MAVERPFNDGEWTAARMRAFVMSALRGARWPVKYKVLAASKVERRTNPETGRLCWFHQCACCQEQFTAKEMRVDHIEPVVPIEGFDSWDQVIGRLFVEAEGLQAICIGCHDAKSGHERKLRGEVQAGRHKGRKAPRHKEGGVA